MCGAIFPFPHYAFTAWCSVKKKHKADLLPISNIMEQKRHIPDKSTVK
jgi:hypothetical protein